MTELIDLLEEAHDDASMAHMNALHKLTFAPTVMARAVGNEMVILDLASGTYFGLDPIGARIWQLMAEGKTLSEICDTMAQEYDVPRPDFERDLLALVSDLRSHGLIDADAN